MKVFPNYHETHHKIPARYNNLAKQKFKAILY